CCAGAAMPETAVGEEGRRGPSVTFLPPLLHYCYRRVPALKLTSGEGKQLSWRYDRQANAAIREEAMADDFRLLFEAIPGERLPGLQLIAIAAERMAHQRQIEAPLDLRLPDMGHLMDEEALATKR